VPCAAEKVDSVAFEAKNTQKRHEINVGSDPPRKPWLDIEYIIEEMEGLECMDGGKA